MSNRKDIFELILSYAESIKSEPDSEWNAERAQWIIDCALALIANENKMIEALKKAKAERKL